MAFGFLIVKVLLVTQGDIMTALAVDQLRQHGDGQRRRHCLGARIILTGANLKWATAKAERTSQRGNSDRAQGWERQTERGGDFNDQPPF